MKKILAIIFIIIAVSVTASAAIPEQSYLCTVNEADLSGENYQIYFQGCRGHYSYEDDSITLYITNTSSREIYFQVVIGYSGSEQTPTTAESGYVLLKPQVTGKFVLKKLYDIPEKANTELGYVPNSHLGEGSVVRVQARGIKAGDTFIVCGMNNYSNARDIGYSSLEANSIIARPTVYEYIDDARLVIKKQVEEKTDEVTEYTLTQPPTEIVNIFIAVTVASAIVCVGGLIIYTVVFIIKRRERND